MFIRYSLSLRDLALEINPGAQYLSDAPGLRETASRSVRRVTIKDLADRAYAGGVQMLGNGLEQGLRKAGIPKHAKVRAGEGSEQPRPHRAHVVGGVAMPRITGVGSNVSGFVRAQAAQSVAGQKIPAAALDNRAHLRRRQRAVRQ